MSTRSDSKGRVTVVIATRNRQDRVLACIRSFDKLSGQIDEVLVFDDASAPPLNADLIEKECSVLGVPCRTLRVEQSAGPPAARNTLAREARTKYILSLDDDVVVLNGGGLRKAVEILDEDEAVSAIAFPQVNKTGELEAGMEQPCHADHPCYVDRFYGYSTLLRRDHFFEVGGYREFLVYYAEEPDLSLRFYAAGHKVVFVPARSFAHLPEQRGRDYAKLVRFSARNSCWCSFLNMPLPLAFGATWNYLRWHRNTLRDCRIKDDEGRKWVMQELVKQFPRLLRERRPASWRVVLAWKRIQKQTPAYVGLRSTENDPMTAGAGRC